MSWLRSTSVDSVARRHAALDVNLIEDEIVRRLGPRPMSDPVGNHEHGRFTAALGRATDVAELSDDIARLESESGRHTRPILILLGLIFFFAVELFGGVLVMRALGLGSGEAIPVGIMLGVALIAITAVVSTQAGAPPASGAPTTPPRRRLSLAAIILLAYTALVLAIALVRLRAATDEGSLTDALPETVLMVATAVGPAWLTDYLLRLWRPATRLAAEIRRLRRRRRLFDREREAGDVFMTKFARSQAAYDAKAARLRATYLAEHRAATAARSAPTSPTALSKGEKK